MQRPPPPREPKDNFRSAGEDEHFGVCFDRSFFKNNCVKPLFLGFVKAKSVGNWFALGSVTPLPPRGRGRGRSRPPTCSLYSLGGPFLILNTCLGPHLPVSLALEPAIPLRPPESYCHPPGARRLPQRSPPSRPATDVCLTPGCQDVTFPSFRRRMGGESDDEQSDERQLCGRWMAWNAD